MNSKVKILSWCCDKTKMTIHFYAKVYYHISIMFHIACFCYKTKNKREQMKNMNDDNDYAFVMHNEALSQSICK